MRRRFLGLALVPLLAACDPELAALLAPEAPSPSGRVTPAQASPGRGPATAGPAIQGERIAPRDTGAEAWIGGQPGWFEAEGSRLTILGNPGGGRCYYNRPLGERYVFRFKESRPKTTAAISVHWNLDPVVGFSKDEAGAPRPNAEAMLVLQPNGDVELRIPGAPAQLRKAVPGPRAWELRVDGRRYDLRLNGEPFFAGETPAGYHPSPFLALGRTVRGTVPTVLEDVVVESDPPGPRATLIRQWSLEGRKDVPARMTLFVATDREKLPTPDEMDTLPALLAHVAAAGGGPLSNAEALIWGRTDSQAYGHRTGNGLYLAVAKLKANPTATHEMAHGFGSGGSRAARSGEGVNGWLNEGLASYLADLAWNRYQGRPEWLAPRIGKTPGVGGEPGFDPPLSETNDATRAAGGSAQYKAYTKGRIFYHVLAARTSHDDLRAVLGANRDVPRVTGEMFLAALEARSGKSLADLRPGWLVKGPYAGVSPADANDADGDGLLGFQEQAWGTRPDRADTDGDGARDDAERLAGTDPRDPASGPAPRAPGLAEGLGAPGPAPGAEAEPYPHPEDEGAEEPGDEAFGG